MFTSRLIANFCVWCCLSCGHLVFGHVCLHAHIVLVGFVLLRYLKSWLVVGHGQKVWGRCFMLAQLYHPLLSYVCLQAHSPLHFSCVIVVVQELLVCIWCFWIWRFAKQRISTIKHDLAKNVFILPLIHVVIFALFMYWGVHDQEFQSLNRWAGTQARTLLQWGVSLHWINSLLPHSCHCLPSGGEIMHHFDGVTKG